MFLSSGENLFPYSYTSLCTIHLMSYNLKYEPHCRRTVAFSHSMSLIESESASRVNHALTVAGEQEQQLVESQVRAAFDDFRYESLVSPTESYAIPLQVQDERHSKLQHPSYRLLGHVGPIYSVKFSPNGEHMATGGKDGRVLIWDVYPTPVNMDAVDAHRGEILDLCFLHDNSSIVSVGTDRMGQVVDMETATCVRELLHRSDVWGVAANGRGPHVMGTATAQGSCFIWDDRQKVCSQILVCLYCCEFPNISVFPPPPSV
jgi:WD40 repeat protein